MSAAGDDATRKARVEYKLVVIAASAGGLPALTRVLGALPRDFPLPVAVVQHLYPSRQSLVPQILGRSVLLDVKQAKDAETLQRGTVYVAPPDWHLEIERGDVVLLTRSAPVHYTRPAADRLFQTAASALGPVVAVILSGSGEDGTPGAIAVRAAGGVVIAQDQATSAFFGMPGAAIDAHAVDYVLPLEQIAGTLIELAGGHA
jgi:two-component system chemotaxis response regulator CheB